MHLHLLPCRTERAHQDIRRRSCGGEPADAEPPSAPIVTCPPPRPIPYVPIGPRVLLAIASTPSRANCAAPPRTTDRSRIQRRGRWGGRQRGMPDLVQALVRLSTLRDRATSVRSLHGHGRISTTESQISTRPCPGISLIDLGQVASNLFTSRNPKTFARVRVAAESRLSGVDLGGGMPLPPAGRRATRGGGSQFADLNDRVR